MSWKKVLEGVRSGLEVGDACALVGVLPDEIDGYLDASPRRRRELARVEAEFRREMVGVVVEAVQIKRDSKSAQWLLKRKLPDRNQMQLKFEGQAPVTLTLDMPDNGRGLSRTSLCETIREDDPHTL